MARLRDQGHAGGTHGADRAWPWRELLVPILAALGWRDIPRPLPWVGPEQAGSAAQTAPWRAPGASAFLRIQGRRALLVHAMDPAASLARAGDALVALRRRAWSADAPLLLVIGARELAIYDCRVKPAPGDRAGAARILRLARDAYAARWDAIAGLLAPAAVARLVEDPDSSTLGKRRGVVTVTAALVAELETWCWDLARAACHGPCADADALERAARRALDRILFLCLCEARGIAPRGRLRGLCGRPRVDRALAALYRDTGRAIALRHGIASPGPGGAAGPDDGAGGSGDARDPRNPDHGHRDGAPELPRLDDAVLSAIILALHAPDSPYEFSVLSPEILGSVYEHSLTRRLRITRGQGGPEGVRSSTPCGMPQGMPEAIPEVALIARPGTRKASGTYYTPRRMVDHVVTRTVGAFLHGKTPEQARDLRVLDPACGAGSFLLGAYRYVLHWHRHAYLQAGAAGGQALGQASGQAADRLYRDASGTWRLRTRERVRILIDTLHGVDIDAQAVDRTRLSLLVVALKGALEEERALEPSAACAPAARLSGRARGSSHHGRPHGRRHIDIHCGNALVAPDFFAAQGRDMDAAEAARVNAFDWARAFPEVLGRARPGFDVVLGNPPWGQKGIMERPAVKAYVRERFLSLKGVYDLFRPFVEQGIRLLRGDVGHFGMVLPDIVLLKDYQETRRYLLDHLMLTHIDWWGRAFRPAVIDAATVVGVKRTPPRAHAVQVAVRASKGSLAHAIPQADFRANERYVFNLTLTPERRAMVEHLARGPRIGDFFEVHEGVHSGNMRAALFVAHAVDDSCRPLLLGRDEIAPYGLRWAGRFIRLDAVPAQPRGTEPRRGAVRHRGARYAHTGRHEWFQADKILVRRTGDRVLAAVDRQARYASNNFFVVLPRVPCALGLDGLCALLNSRLMTWYFRAIEPRKGRAFAELKIKHLAAFPLPAGVGAPGREARDRACSALDRLGAERQELATALLAAGVNPHTGPHTGPHAVPQTGLQTDLAALERRRDALDREIERTVYAMFAICDQDIRIMESA